MSGKSAKKFRKVIRNSATEAAQGILKPAFFKLARQRDTIFIIAICELITIIILAMALIAKGI